MFSRFFIDRPVFSWVIAIIIMLAGILSISTLPVSQYPQIAPPQVSITATYPGASASTIENTVTQVIEQNLTGLDGYLYMQSTSDSAGRVSITVTFETGTNPDMAQVQVQNKISTALTSLPQVVQQLGVTIQKTSANFLMVVGFVSKDPSIKTADLGDFLTSNIQEPLARVSGVGEAQVFGASYAMRVWLDPDKLVKYKLNPSDITSAISAQNMQVSTGSLAAQPTDGKQEFTATISSSSLLETPEDFRNILLKVTEEGANVYLRDVAEVKLDQKDYIALGTFNGYAASGMAIKLASGSNALETQAAVLKRVEELKSLMPQGVEVVVPFDTTPFVRAALHEVVVVAPGVHHPVHRLRKAVDIGREDQAAVAVETDQARSKTVIDAIHVVHGAHAEPHLAPGREMALVEGEDARAGSVLKRSLAGHGVGLEGIDGRGDGVADVGLEVSQRIEQVARLRAVELQMEMRALGGTRIAAEPDKLSFVDRHHRRWEGDVGGIDLVGVLVALHGGLDLRGEVV